MTKILRNLVLSAVAFVAAAGVTSGIANADTGGGFDGCNYGKSRNAVLTPGQQSGMPATCRLQTCQFVYRQAVKTSFTGNTPPILVISWTYNVTPAVAPANACPAEVEAGGTTGWHAP